MASGSLGKSVSLMASKGKLSHVAVHRQSFMAIGTKMGPDSIRLTNETWWDTINERLPELSLVKNLTLNLSPQVMTKSWLEAARASGGDALDFEPGDGVLSEF